MEIKPIVKQLIEFHILQSFPATCLNRDDVNAPKTANIGGVPRARVSSQCWKRQVRLTLRDLGVHLGIRTAHVEDIEEQFCKSLGASDAEAKACAKAIAKALTKKSLLFFTETEANAFAKFAAEKKFDAAKLDDQAIQQVSKKVLNPAVDGLDIALFGRMVAQATKVDLNVQAAASFAHAISTHAVDSDLDFFTALDDMESGQLSAHMGTVEFNSATYYRYVSLDLNQLSKNLRGEGLKEAVTAFIKALFIAIPSARQTTMSGACGWDYARVLVRNGQRIQLSFDKPVKAKDGYVQPSIAALDAGLAAKKAMNGSLFGQVADFTIGGDSPMSIDELIEHVVSSCSLLKGETDAKADSSSEGAKHA